MGRLIDWFSRNRAKIGGTLSSIAAGVATIDPQLIAAHPRLTSYALLAFGIIFGGGKFKSDSYHRNQQDRTNH